MVASPVYNAFKRTSCVELRINAEMPLARSTIAKARACLGGKRRNLPYSFGLTNPGEGKNRIGASAALFRLRPNRFGLSVWWFETTSEPPSAFGRLSDLLECLEEPFGEREVQVYAVFSYDKDAVESMFKPIHVAEQPTIFDELVGFTGIKRDPHGKLLYQVEVSLGTKRLIHAVRFAQVLKLSLDMPLPLLETANRISSLALKMKQS
jgi:hypothetical protein